MLFYVLVSPRDVNTTYLKALVCLCDPLLHETYSILITTTVENSTEEGPLAELVR